MSIMRMEIAIVLVALVLGCQGNSHNGNATSPSTRVTEGPGNLRIMTYNIRHTLGDDGKCDPARIAAVITNEHPDLVAVQEVDLHTDRVNGMDTPAELSRLTGMHVAFGKAIDFQHGEYGQLILSKYPIASSAVHLLPGNPAAEQRITLATMIDLPDGRGQLRFISTHLDAHDNADRVAQATDIVKFFGTPDSTPTIIAGDFNSIPESAPQKIMAAAFTDTAGPTKSPTFPSSQPTRKIDWIFVREPQLWTVSNSTVVQAKGASDHSALRVDLTRAASTPK